MSLNKLIKMKQFVKIIDTVLCGHFKVLYNQWDLIVEDDGGCGSDATRPPTTLLKRQLNWQYLFPLMLCFIVIPDTAIILLHYKYREWFGETRSSEEILNEIMVRKIYPRPMWYMSYMIVGTAAVQSTGLFTLLFYGHRLDSKHRLKRHRAANSSQWQLNTYEGTGNCN